MSLPRRLQCVRWWDTHGRLLQATCRRFRTDRRALMPLLRRYERAVARGGVPAAEPWLTADEAISIVEAILREARNHH